METIACIFCSQHSSTVVISENGYTGLKCPNCNIIYISPRLNSEEIKFLYTEDQKIKYADAQFQFDKFKKFESERTIKKIRKYRKSGSILELGAGGGFFLMKSREDGYDPYGIELNPIEAKFINENLHIPCETDALSKDSFGGKIFDIIYHRDVLSHLYDPVSVFSNINRAMKKNGLLVFETGNIADVKKKHYKLFSQFSYPDHLFFFGEKSLNILLERTGFKLIKIYKDALLFQLLLQKALWKMKDPLKEKNLLDDVNRNNIYTNTKKHLSIKRQLRLFYRYVSNFLIRLGVILPRKGYPLKLLVIAEKTKD